MKILFLVRNAWYFRHFSQVVRILCDRGHQVRLQFVMESKKDLLGTTIEEFENNVDGCQVAYSSPYNRRRLRFLSQLEELQNYALYFEDQWPSQAIIDRWEKKFLSRSKLYPRPIKYILNNRTVREFVKSKIFQSIIKVIITKLLPDRKILRQLKEFQPDVVMASPYVFSPYLEVEYVRAAQHLGVPTLAALASWDNLTTKGTIHLMPGVFTVWNEPLKNEAVDIHGVLPGRIILTGAPTFDPWFGLEPTLDKESLCSRVGIDQDSPYIVYLCSSYSMAGDERAFVRAFLEGLRVNPDTKNINVIIRPHPIYADQWSEFNEPKYTVWPRGGNIPASPEARQDYFNILYHSLGVVGVNTSAFLEAAIVDKPCVTIMTDHYRNTQVDGFYHFRHLLNGGFLEIANSFDESALIISDINSGIDSKALQRREFVMDFIRPHGLDTSASEILADTIESVAMGRHNETLKSL